MKRLLGRGVRSRIQRPGAQAWVALTAWLVPAAAVFAQKPSRPVEDQGSVLQWVIAFGIIVVIGFSAFLNPKRSHLN